MTAQTNFISTNVALKSAQAWLKQVAKKYNIRGAVGDIYQNSVGLSAGGGNFGCDRYAKLEKLIEKTRNGFEKSKNWVAVKGESTFRRSVFVSKDGRFQAVVYKSYNENFGWKTATMSFGVSIKDLQVTE